MAEGPDEAVMSEIGGDLESFLKETREGANEVFRRKFSCRRSTAPIFAERN